MSLVSVQLNMSIVTDLKHKKGLRDSLASNAGPQIKREVTLKKTFTKTKPTSIGSKTNRLFNLSTINI